MSLHLKQNPISPLRTFNNLLCAILIYKVGKKYEIEVDLLPLLRLFIGFLTGSLFKVGQKVLTPDMLIITTLYLMQK